MTSNSTQREELLGSFKTVRTLSKICQLLLKAITKDKITLLASLITTTACKSLIKSF